jgi:hypothetical protein
LIKKCNIFFKKEIKMKSQRQKLLLVIFFSVGLLVIGMNMNRACGLVNNQIIYLQDDPNEPDPEITFMGDDPNEPDPEITFMGDDPNEPEPEPEIVFMADDPNEPEPEYK